MLLLAALSAVLGSAVTGCRSLGGSASDGAYGSGSSSGGGCCPGH